MRAMHDTTYTSAEVCAASGATLGQLQHWRVLGIVSAENTNQAIIEASQCVELTKANLSGRQQQRLCAVQRAELNDLPPAVRLVRSFEHYIESVVTLASVFGRGPGYDDWLARQRKQLAWMKGEFAPHAQRSARRRRRDDRLLRQFIATNRAQQDAAAPLAS